MTAAPLRSVPPPDDGRRPAIGLDLVDGFSLVDPLGPVVVPIAQQRLLAYLALAGRPTARRQLAYCLWPDLADDRARGALRSALYRLHQLTDADLVEWFGDRAGIGQAVSCDVHRVRSWTERVLHGTTLDGDEAGDPASLGELLPGWDDDWVVLERERFRQRALHAHELLVDRLVADGRPADAVEAALAAVLADPLRESANRAVVIAHLACGNRVEALRHYTSFAARLRRELGLEPTPAMQALVHDLCPAAGSVSEAARG